MWSFELGAQEVIRAVIWIINGFQQRKRQDSPNFNNDTFYKPPVTNAQCLIGFEKYPDSAVLLNYDDYYYSHGYGQIKETFKALTKNEIVKSYISDNDFRSSNHGIEIGYSLYVFDIQYQKNLENAQSIKVEFKFSEIILVGIYGYALVLSNKLVSISSDGQRHFDLN